MIVATAGAGCGGGGPECGPGTDEVDGQCVPADDGVSCAEGTTEVDGQCVPDGSVICETGTVYDPDSGTCVLDESGCAEGTVLVAGECVPEDDTLTGDVMEPSEPNGLNEGDVPGSFTTPDEGDNVTIEGCITPFEDIDQNSELDADLDVYTFQVDAPTMLDVTVDGINGLAGAFWIAPTDQQMTDDGWVRYGVNMVGDTSQRQVFLPKAGTYAMVITDSRSVFGLSFGSDDTCYFATVSVVGAPSATAIAQGGETVQSTLGAPEFYSYDPNTQDLIFGTATAPSESAAAGVTVMVNGFYERSTAFSGEGQPASSFAGGLADNDELVFIVDPVIDYAVSDVGYDLEVVAPGVEPVPMDGTITVTNDGDLFRWLAFDASEGDVVNLDFSTDGSPLFATLLTPDLTLASELCPQDAPCETNTDWVQLATGGTYYLRLFDTSETQPASFELTITREHVQPTPVTLGTALTGQTLGDQNSDFYEVDASASDWVTYWGAPTNFEGTMDVLLYPRGQSGTLDQEVIDQDSFAFDGTGAARGRIHPGGGGTWLVRVSDGGTPTGDETYDLDIAEQVYTDLGTVDENTPVDMTDISIGTDETVYFLGQGNVGDIATITATGAAGNDLVVSTLDDEEGTIKVVDDTGDGAAEVVTMAITTDGWFALAIEDSAGAAGMFDLGVTSEPPPTYTATAGTLGFTSVCPGQGGSGTAVTFEPTSSIFPANDEGLAGGVAVPFDFEFFGALSSDITISTNGWMSFADVTGSVLSNAAIPTASAPNSLVAAHWDDLVETTACVESSAGQVVVEWRATEYGDETAVEVQVVLHDDDSIDIIYGSGHASDSDESTIGIEDLAGSTGEQISYNTAGNADPGTSWTLTVDTP